MAMSNILILARNILFDILVHSVQKTIRCDILGKRL